MVKTWSRTTSALLLGMIRDNPDIAFLPKLYICNTRHAASTDKWIDFTDRCEINGRNSLQDIGPIAIVGELGASQYATSDISVTVKNIDNFWNDDPSTNITSYQIRDVDGTAVTCTDFADSVGWEGNRARITRQYTLAAGVVEEVWIDDFFMDKIIPGDSESGLAQLRLVGLQKALMNADASQLKNGNIPFRHRAVKEMVAKLLGLAFTDAQIQEFSLPLDIKILNQLPCYAGDPTERRAVSIADRLPHQDVYGTHIDAEYKGLVCRWLLNDEDAPGGADWIYCGINEELYRYSRSGDYVELLTAGDASDLGAGYNIRRLFYDTTSGKVYGVAWNDPITIDVIVGGHWYIHQAKTIYGTMKIFSWDGTTFSALSPADADGALAKMCSGEFHIRKGNKEHPLFFHSGIGQSTYNGFVENCGENLTLPFNQYFDFYATWNLITGHETIMMRKGSTGILDNTGLVYPDDVESGPRWGGPDLSAIATDETAAPGADMWVRFSLGQSGLCVFNDLNRKIIFCAIDTVPTADPSVWTLYVYDIATNTVESVKNGGVPVTIYQPLCGASDGDYIYIAIMDWKNTGTDNSICYIYQLQVSTGILTKKYDASTDATTPTSPYYTILELTATGLGDFIVSLLKRDEFTAGAASTGFLLASYNLEEPTKFLTPTTKQSGQFKGLVYDPDSTCAFPVNCADGYLYRWTPGSEPLRADNKNNIGDTEFNLSSNLILITDADAAENQIFGISAPGYPAQFLETPLNGAYALFKLSKYVFPYRPDYDFENPATIDAWLALGALAQWCQYIIFFAKGIFYFIPKSTDPDDSVATFANDGSVGSNRIIQSITPDLGKDEVFNYCAIVPYKITIAPPQISKQIGPDSTWDGEHHIDATVATQSPITVVLRAKDAGNNFQFKPSFNLIKARLNGDHLQSAVNIFTDIEPSVIISDAIAVNDEIVVLDVDNNEHRLTIASVDAATSTLTIPVPGLPDAMKSGDEITIYKYNNQTWLDMTEDYVTPFTSPHSGASIPIGMSYKHIQNWDGSVLITTNVWIKIDGGTFTAGDIITVKSDGLQLAAAPESVKVSVNSNSVKAYGKIEYSKVDNRFHDSWSAENMSVAVVAEYSPPHWLTKFTAIWQDVKVGDIVLLVDRKGHKSEPAGRVFVRVRALSLRADNYVDYSIRSIKERIKL